MTHVNQYTVRVRLRVQYNKLKYTRTCTIVQLFVLVVRRSLLIQSSTVFTVLVRPIIIFTYVLTRERRFIFAAIIDAQLRCT